MIKDQSIIRHWCWWELRRLVGTRQGAPSSQWSVGSTVSDIYIHRYVALNDAWTLSVCVCQRTGGPKEPNLTSLSWSRETAKWGQWGGWRVYVFGSRWLYRNDLHARCTVDNAETKETTTRTNNAIYYTRMMMTEADDDDEKPNPTKAPHIYWWDRKTDM